MYLGPAVLAGTGFVVTCSLLRLHPTAETFGPLLFVVLQESGQLNGRLQTGDAFQLANIPRSACLFKTAGVCPAPTNSFLMSQNVGQVLEPGSRL